MGVATILSNLGGGKYTVKVHFRNELVESAKTNIDAWLIQIDDELESLDADRLIAQQKLDQVLDMLNDVMNTL